MHVQVLQHVPFEGLGSMRPWLERRGAAIHFTHLSKGELLPAHEGIDLVIAMGGPMSVNDEAEHPWLAAEKDWLAQAIERRVPTLGVCLGAQLIAEALGATVRPLGHKEIGWFEAEAVATAPDCFGFPVRFPAFHWHGDTFELPANATHLARSRGCENQAFQVGRHVIGLQFHLETTHATMKGLISRLGHELTPGPWVQDAERMQAEPPDSFRQIHDLIGQVLTYLMDEAVHAASTHR